MMDALIAVWVAELKKKTASGNFQDETDRPLYDTATDSDGKTSLELRILSCLQLGFRLENCSLYRHSNSPYYEQARSITLGCDSQQIK